MAVQRVLVCLPQVDRRVWSDLRDQINVKMKKETA